MGGLRRSCVVISMAKTGRLQYMQQVATNPGLRLGKMISGSSNDSMFLLTSAFRVTLVYEVVIVMGYDEMRCPAAGGNPGERDDPIGWTLGLTKWARSTLFPLIRLHLLHVHLGRLLPKPFISFLRFMTLI